MVSIHKFVTKIAAVAISALLPFSLCACEDSAGPASAPTTRSAGAPDSRPKIAATTASTSPAATTTPADELNVVEAVFRHQFQHNASGVKQGAPAYFLKVMGKDPTAAFLKRFDGNHPPIRPGSEFSVGHGLEFRVESVKWITPDSAEVIGGYYEANLSASGNRYQVVRKDGKWAVVKDVMEWIS